MDSEKLTPEEVKYWYGEQDEFGNDLTWLRHNLTLTPTERYQKHQRRLLSVMRVREAVRIARSRKTS